MKEILISDYGYELPSERIALHPLSERDESKLLVYQKGDIVHTSFKNIDGFVPNNCTLFFNNTRVIPARLTFTKTSGAEIEVFILHSIEPSSLVYEAMQAVDSTTWKCAIGNLKRWPDGLLLSYRFSSGELTAELISREDAIVRFRWNSKSITFAEVVKECGATPLPPYLKRKATKEDKDRYQTIYSQADGAVAAPTAGLHFTETVLNTIEKKGVGVDFLTLHVSAGTFLPVKTTNALDHQMHSEQVVVQKSIIEKLLIDDQKVIAVGTTSMRTLESLYWYGVKLIADNTAEFIVYKMDPYELANNITKKESLRAIYNKMTSEGLEFIAGETSIYIVPSYSFKICNGLITNFHQPSSTLMLLVAAFVGDDWKKIYEAALKNEYRFLSYGDSSLLLP
jgi:S-adenosylmethionine:tRNA ribosyltransferase-isomerase